MASNTNLNMIHKLIVIADILCLHIQCNNNSSFFGCLSRSNAPKANHIQRKKKSHLKTLCKQNEEKKLKNQMKHERGEKMKMSSDTL